MATRVQRFSIYAGEDRTLTFSIVDSAGTAVDCTGYTARFRARLRGDSSATLDYDSSTDSEIAWTDDAAGEGEVVLAQGDTATLTEGAIYDWQIEIDSGSEEQITHVGEIEVRDSLWV
jgi:hypothetical protein